MRPTPRPDATRSFGRAGGRELAVDVFVPRERANGTAVLLLHGGSWRRGDRSLVYPHAERLRLRGYCTLAVDYRLLGEAPWPAALEDVECAAEWVRDHARELGVDAGKVAVVGLSAGGHLALLTGVRRQLTAVVALYAPVLLSLEPATDGGFPAEALLGDAASAERAREASPLTYAGREFPPTMFVHGTADGVVSYQPTVRMHDALVQAGVVADLHLVGGVDHAFDYGASHGEAVAELVDAFLRRTVVEPARVARETPRPEDMRAAIEAAPGVPAIEVLRTLLEP